MRTEDLVRTLATDHGHRPPPLRLSLWLAIALGLLLGAVLFWTMLGPRPDIALAARDPRFILKFVVTLALAVSAAGLLLRLVRPGASAGRWTSALLIGPVLLGLGILYELASVPASTWIPRLIGTNARLCLSSIPLLAAPTLAALLWAMRAGAPTRPALAGALAGLVAGGLGAALYAAHCIDDSPLFVVTWYGLAIALVTAIGFAAGSRLLRW
jgi:hypothetical protein